MYSRAVRPALISSRVAATSKSQQQAGMATLREIEQRLKSVRNIEKITKSMKVVASTKLTRAEKAMREAKKYGAANNELFTQSKGEEESTSTSGEKPKILYIGVSSDGGLCGGIHSSISRQLKKDIAKEPGHIAVIGDKPKAQLARSNAKDFTVSFSAVGKDVPTFAEASAIADEIVQKGGEWDEIRIVSNKYISALSYEPQTTTVISAKALESAAGFQQYEVDGESSKDLAEFALANAIYSALVEGHAAEISARRNAMDNASNNAGDMINSLQLKYNRGRQAVITSELIDIITGASAL